MAQIFLGTVAPETIVGTNEPDHLDNKVGQDTVVETATVGTQKLPAVWTPSPFPSTPAAAWPYR
jgi:hypothetical protein